MKMQISACEKSRAKPPSSLRDRNPRHDGMDHSEEEGASVLIRLHMLKDPLRRAFYLGES